jgi:dienelactone hydrolase
MLTTSELSDAMAGLAALRALPGIDPDRVVVAGHSFGGQLAILSAELDQSLRGVLVFSGGSAIWGRAPALRAVMLRALGATSVPVFLGYATDDNDEPGRVMAAELTRLNKTHQLAIYPSGGHNFVFAASHPANADMFKFLAAHVRR